jgi:3-hydroxybutyryl-CoA dehydrogenase
MTLPHAPSHAPSYAIIAGGDSRAFPPGDPFLAGAVPSEQAEVMIFLAGAPFRSDPARTAILIELGCECLGVHTGEAAGEEGSNVLGLARWRNGADPPSPLVELVRQPRSADGAIAAARDVLASAGLTVVVVADQAGRIVDRLLRPKLNAALRFLDEGLASAHDMDVTCRLGLGYPEGPIERVQRGGLADHHDVCRALFEIYGTAAYAPARRAVVAAHRRAHGVG